MEVNTIRISDLINSEKGKPIIYIPESEKERILRLYGNWTMDDLEKYNQAIDKGIFKRQFYYNLISCSK